MSHRVPLKLACLGSKYMRTGIMKTSNIPMDVLQSRPTAESANEPIKIGVVAQGHIKHPEAIEHFSPHESGLMAQVAEH